MMEAPQRKLGSCRVNATMHIATMSACPGNTGVAAASARTRKEIGSKALDIPYFCRVNLFRYPSIVFCACKITASSLSESSGFILMKRPTFTPVPVAAGRAEEVRRVIAISLNFLFIIKHALWSFACLSYGAPSPLFILSPVSPEEIHRNFRCLHRKGLLGIKLL